MHSRPVAERLLSLAIGTPRASALYGDLEELSPTRGRLWFWLAYTRALLPSAWRAAVSIFALALPWRYSYWIEVPLTRSMWWVFRTPSYIHPAPFRSFWIFTLGNAHLGLLFLLPFLLFRFGLRDRLTQLACAITLLGLPFFSGRPHVVGWVVTLTVALIVTGLSLRKWRRPMIVLLLTLFAWHELLDIFFVLHSIGLSHSGAFVLFELARTCIAAIVCTVLHSLLLHPKPNTNPSSPGAPFMTASSS